MIKKFYLHLFSFISKMSGPFSFILKSVIEYFLDPVVDRVEHEVNKEIKKKKVEDYEKANSSDERIDAFNDIP